MKGLKGLLEENPRLKVFIYAGKGGLGKTTLSAATAVKLSSLGKKTLVFSTDPQASLSDVFEQNVFGKGEVKIAENLYVMEIDADKRIHEYVSSIKKKIIDMEPALAWIGEWPRFTLLFYRATLQPVDKRWEELIRQHGIEPTQWLPPAYGFFAFLIYAVRKLTGADWKEAYCKALELVRDYVQETRAGTSPTEEFVDKVLAEMSKWPCTK